MVCNTAADHRGVQKREQTRVESSSDTHERHSSTMHHVQIPCCLPYASLVHPLCVREFRSATASTRVLDRLTYPVSLSLSFSHFLAKPLAQMHSKLSVAEWIHQMMGFFGGAGTGYSASHPAGMSTSSSRDDAPSAPFPPVRSDVDCPTTLNVLSGKRISFRPSGR